MGEKRTVDTARRERKNEVIILGKLDEIMSGMGKQNIEIALIKKSQDDTNDHLKTLNGKVLQHERSLNDQSIINLTASNERAILKDRMDNGDTAAKEKKSFWQTFQSQLSWGAFCVVMLLVYKVLVFAGIISDFLHKS